jgi:hypothetical protein
LSLHDQALRGSGLRNSPVEVLSRAAIFWTHVPQPVPAAERETTSLMVQAPSAMHPRTSVSVTARQMQTYMALALLERVI